MGLPTVPAIPPVSTAAAANLLLASIAFEELALAHIINAEGEKLQFALGTLIGNPTAGWITDLLNINESFSRTLRNVLKKQMLLQLKLEDVIELIELQPPPPPPAPRVLYVANSNDNTVEIYDISLPRDLVRVRQFNGENLSGPTGLAATGTTLYVANFDADNVAIYDISNRTDPVPVRQFNEAGPNGLAITGTTLYVANFNADNVGTYDISIPTASVIVSQSNGENLSGPTGLAVTGTTLYVANNDNFVAIYDISTPEDPVPAGQFSEDLSGPAGLAATGTTLYVANFNADNVGIYDISIPPNPVRCG